jgi:transketolase
MHRLRSPHRVVVDEMETAAYDELAKEGITVRVIDLFSVQPIDREALSETARATGGKVITVEDHYEHGGLGDAVMAALSDQNVRVRKLAVRGIAHSGQPKELLDRFGISARHIVDAVKQQLA